MIALAFLICLALAVPAYSAEYCAGVVISVANGDTLSVLTKDKQQVKIRLYGIDCPERNRHFGTHAKQATSDAVFGKHVTFQPISTDSYGRMVAIVLMSGGKSLNEHLVRNGMASVNPQSCTQNEICEPLKKLEQATKAQRRGLWADKDKMPLQDGAEGLVWRPLTNSGGGRSGMAP